MRIVANVSRKANDYGASVTRIGAWMDGPHSLSIRRKVCWGLSKSALILAAYGFQPISEPLTAYFLDFSTAWKCHKQVKSAGFALSHWATALRKGIWMPPTPPP